MPAWPIFYFFWELIMPVSDQGLNRTRFCVIPRTLIFATRPGEVLLIKGAPNKHLWANLYNGVGGHIEPGEDILTAGRREFREETGLDLVNAWLCGVVLVNTGTSPGVGIFVLRGEAAPGILRVSAEGELSWKSVDDGLYTLPMVEDLPVLLPRILAHPSGSPPFCAASFYDQQERLQIKFAE
jgi:8-oxo-dGTP diphosphatase